MKLVLDSKPKIVSQGICFIGQNNDDVKEMTDKDYAVLL